jgi:hypothetical protein
MICSIFHFILLLSLVSSSEVQWNCTEQVLRVYDCVIYDFRDHNCHPWDTSRCSRPKFIAGWYDHCPVTTCKVKLVKLGLKYLCLKNISFQAIEPIRATEAPTATTQVTTVRTEAPTEASTTTIATTAARTTKKVN